VNRSSIGRFVERARRELFATCSIAECLRVAHVCAAMGMGVHLGGCAAPGMVDSAITRLALSTPEIDVYAEAGESAALVEDQLSGVVFDGAFATSDGRPGPGGVAPEFAI
jgi:hypothetical protein